MTPSDDWDLVRRCVAGDEAALGVLAVRYGDTVRFVARRELGQDCTDLCEDVVQDVWWRLWRFARRLTPQPSSRGVAGWLVTVATNSARRARAQEARHRSRCEPLDTAMGVAAVHGDDDHERGEMRARVAAVLAAVPEAYRTVLLAAAQGVPQAVLAASLGVPVGTVKSRLSRARAYVRETYGAAA